MANETTTSGFKDALANALKDSEIVYVNRSEFHFSQDRNARPSSHPAYGEEAIEELMNSIEAFGGLFEPLILTGIKAREETGFAQYSLVSGNRRCIALDRLAAKTNDSKWVEKIPCRIAQSGSQTAIVRAIQLIENSGRRDLDAGSVAQSLIEIHQSFGGDVSMADVCKIVGADKDKTELFKRIVLLPQAIKDAISSGDIDDKKVFLMADAKYEIGDTEWAVVLRLAKQLSVTSFKSALEKMFVEQDDTSTTPATPKPSTVKATDLKKYYLPAVQERYSAMATAIKDYTELCEGLEDGEAPPPKPECLNPVFSARDVEVRILDTLNVILGTGSEKSKLMEVVNPFMKAIKETEDKDKATKKAGSARDKWIRSQVTSINKCLKMPMDVVTGKRPFATLADALAGVVTTWGNLSASEANETGFDLAAELGDKPKKESLTQEVHTAWVESEKAKRTRAAAAAKKKQDKADAEAKAAASAKAA